MPGVFDGNIYDSTVNGALWTMMVQFLCYIYVYFAYLLKIANDKRKNLYLIISCLVAFCGLLVFNLLNIKILIAMIRSFLCFAFGGYLYYSNKSDKKLLLFVTLLSVLCLIINNYITINIFLIIGVTYFIVYLCKNFDVVVKNKILTSIFSSSYELYLVGFPIQQALVSLNGGSMNIYLNFVIGLSIAIILSVIVRMLSEKMIKVLKF